MSKGAYSFRLIVICIAAVLALAGCQTGATPTSSPSAASPEASTAESDAPDVTPAEVVCTSVTMEGGQGLFADAIRDAFFIPFEADTGIKVIPAPEDDNSIIRGMVETGNYTVDVEYVGIDWVLPPNGTQYLEPLDYSVIDKDGILEGLAHDHGIGFDTNALVVGWRSDKLTGDPPKTWADVFDVAKYPGKRAITDLYAYQAILPALLADGVAPDELVPFDLDRAFRKLDTIKSDYVSAKSGSQQLDLFSSGEVVIGSIYPNRAAEAREAGAPVDVSWTGQMVDSDFLAIPKGSPNKDCAMKLIAYIVSAPVNGRMSFGINIGPSNTKSEINPEVADMLPAAHLDEPHVVIPDLALGTYLQENQDALEAAFQEWQTR